MKTKYVVWMIIAVILVAGGIAATQISDSTITGLKRLVIENDQAQEALFINQSEYYSNIKLYSDNPYYNSTESPVSFIEMNTYGLNDSNYTTKLIFSNTSGLGDSGFTSYIHSNIWWSKLKISGNRGRGSQSLPEAVQPNDQITFIGAGAYNGTKWRGASAVVLMVDNNHTLYNIPGAIKFWTTSGYRTNPYLHVMYFDSNGSLTIGNRLDSASDAYRPSTNARLEVHAQRQEGILINQTSNQSYMRMTNGTASNALIINRSGYYADGGSTKLIRYDICPADSCTADCGVCTTATNQTNKTFYSSNNSVFNCGVSDTGTFSCSVIG